MTVRAVHDRTPRELHPWTILGRLMTCTVCGAHVDVIEIPHPLLDADRFVCGDHFAFLEDEKHHVSDAQARWLTALSAGNVGPWDDAA